MQTRIIIIIIISDSLLESVQYSGKGKTKMLHNKGGSKKLLFEGVKVTELKEHLQIPTPSSNAAVEKNTFLYTEQIMLINETQMASSAV